MAYGNPNHPAPFDMHKLFRPPISTPNPNPNFNNPFHHPAIFHSPSPSPSPNPNPNHGARLLALLGNPPPPPLESTASMPPPSSSTTSPSSPPPPPPPILHAQLSAPMPARLPSSKKPRGHQLGGGDRAVHDVDTRLPGESKPPQLEVTPITKYISDPGLVLGRQIAVNQSYICYGLKLGNIRVLNIKTALRALLRGHTERVTDMAFFAEDVHLLASASVDGRVYVWKIDEGPDEENKPHITGKIVIAIQIVGEAEPYHPRICWHSHKQEILFVGIGNYVLKVDATKVGKGKEFSADEPLKCPVNKLIDGIHLIGKHDGEVTDLSISQWMTTRLASSSKDGTVKIWEDRRATPLSTLKPHDGQPVNSVEFLTSPHRPDHIVLVTTGPLNREVKIWASASEEGWLLPSDSESWKCTQTLELRSSVEPRPEVTFFNQVVVLPWASLLLLANAKKNAIYVVHVDYGPCPDCTRMDYIADFAVAMPILSLTGTCESLTDGDQVVQVYCVQTHAIQQYAIDLSQCAPVPNNSVELRKDPSNIDAPRSEAFDVLEQSREPTVHESPINTSSNLTRLMSLTSSEITDVQESTGFASNVEAQVSALSPSSENGNTVHAASSHVTSIFDLSGKTSGLKGSTKRFVRLPSIGDHDGDQPQQVPNYPVNMRSDNSVVNPPIDGTSGKDESKKAFSNDISAVPNPPSMFKLQGNAAHLITPAEILSGAISSESTNVKQGMKGDEGKVHDAFANNDVHSVEVEVKVVGESSSNQEQARTLQISEPKDEIAKECCVVPRSVDTDSVVVTEAIVRTTSSMGKEESQGKTYDMIRELSESTSNVAPQLEKKQNSKNFQAVVPSVNASSPFNFTGYSNEIENNASVPSEEAVYSQIVAMQDKFNQLISMHKEMQAQISTLVALPVTREGKRVEAALSRSMEKVVKANVDALWARCQEENVKHEKAKKDWVQHITTLITNSMNKDLPTILERALKKEIISVGSVVARTITPVIEKAISSAIVDSFQRGVSEKAVSLLEKSVNSKLEGSVARQIHLQFQTSGKQALQDALRSNLESLMIPTFELSCKTMFEQVDATFHKGMTEYASAAQQHFEAAHTPLAHTLRDAIDSASSITQNITGELADGQRKLVALLTSGNQKDKGPMGLHHDNGPIPSLPEMVEAPLDPRKELTRLLSEHKHDEAFTLALHGNNVSIVSWLCSQVDLPGICSMSPLPLCQGVLLALLQQLACDINNDTPQKLSWMTIVAVVINPTDPNITLYIRPILEQVYGILAHQRSTSDIRAIMHVINSVMMSCK